MEPLTRRRALPPHIGHRVNEVWANDLRTLALAWLSASLFACGAPLPELGETAARCGDGAVQGLEACDDGNDINTDACTDQCALARCGDSFVQDGEACDDGNISDRDACTNGCVVASCGDGLWRQDLLFEGEEGFERCDDGNDNENDSCTSRCAPPRCGDGLQQENEGCDDGNTVETDACLNTCVPARCGDGLIQQGVEQCDGSEDCSDTCILMSCGDGVIQGSEACDDGNEVLTDACQNCLVARCGDGVMRTDLSSNESGYEACDDGNEEPGDECSVECLIDDHGNSLSTATPLTIPDGLETLVEVMASAAINNAEDSDFFSLTVAHAGVYRFDVDPRFHGNPANNPACRLFRSNGRVAGFQTDRDSQHRGCSVGLYLAVGATAYLEVTKQGTALFSYTIKVQKPCGNGLVDAGEECDPASPDSNAFRCRRDCRNRRSITLAGTTGCAVVNGGVTCWGSNAGLMLGRMVRGSRRCTKEGFHDRTGEVDEFLVEVAPHSVEVIPRTARVQDLSGGWREATCALYHDNTPYCWGRQRQQNSQWADHRNEMLGVCQDDDSLYDPNDEDPKVVGACIPRPIPWANTYSDSVDISFEDFGLVQGLTVGKRSSCLVVKQESGRAVPYCWGSMYNGLLGLPIANCYGLPRLFCRGLGFRIPAMPTPVPDDESVEYIAIGTETACVILESGRVACWGRNDYGQTGSQRAIVGAACHEACELTMFPIRVNIGVAVGVSVGGDHVCAVNQAGHLYCWGRNDRDQTGLPSDDRRCADEMPCVRRATRVPNLPAIIDVAAGEEHTCALDHLGRIHCWGSNTKGQLGSGAVGALRPGGPPQSRQPITVGRLEPMTNLTAGEFSTCARSATERVYCWGDNSLGQLGDGNCTPAVPSPMQVDFVF